MHSCLSLLSHINEDICLSNHVIDVKRASWIAISTRCASLLGLSLLQINFQHALEKTWNIYSLPVLKISFSLVRLYFTKVYLSHRLWPGNEPMTRCTTCTHLSEGTFHCSTIQKKALWYLCESLNFLSCCKWTSDPWNTRPAIYPLHHGGLKTAKLFWQLSTGSHSSLVSIAVC